MSTLTPNYGLHLPENADSMDDFFTNYETDMTTIDDNLGGGGGATIEEMTQAEYEALPDTKLTDNILRGLKDVKSFLDPDILYLGTCYSTSERMVGCWIDGKPLYQITIDLGSDRTFSSDWQSFANKADYPDYEYMSAGMLFASSGVCTHVDLAHNDSTYLELRPKANAGGRYLTYQYTKISDVAGSGTWTPSGVNAVHYDDTEKVIGTWFGETLYEKVVSLTSGIAIGSYGHISMPSDSIIRRFEGYAYRSNHAVVDKFNGYIADGELFASIRSGDIEYWISSIFSSVEEITFTIQYTKSS